MNSLRKRQPVVLYQPRDEGGWMPLGLLALGSRLSDQHVVIVDGRFELAPEARVRELAREACCLGVTVRTGQPLRDALRVSAAARAANPRLHVLWGGPHATSAPESCLAAGIVDGCVRGAGEEPFTSAIAAIRCGRPLDGIPGIVVPGGVVPRAEPAVAPEMLPCAAYSLLDLERHFELRGARRLDYCSSRGARDGSSWSGLAAERVVAELGELAERHRLSEVLFQEEDFLADATRAAAILSGLADLGSRLGWRAAVRVEDVLEGGQERLRLFTASRCRLLCLRVAPGIPARGPRRVQVVEAAKLLHAAGLAARFELAVAEPGPKMESLKAVVSLARALSAIDGHFETPIRRVRDLSAFAAAGLEALAVSELAPWADPRAERRLARACFYFGEAQRRPGRRLGKHLLRMASLLRVRLGFFGLDFDRLAAEASALVRTGRPRPPSSAD